MNSFNFSTKIQDARQRLVELQQRAVKPSVNGEEVLPEAFEELQSTLEELRVAEEELREQNEQLVAAREVLETERQRYEDLFNFAPDAYLVTDVEGTIRETNQAAAQLLKQTSPLLVGKPLIVFVAPQSRQAFHNGLTQLLQGRRMERWQVWLMPRAESNGAPMPVAIKVAVTRDRNAKPIGLRWMLRDITEQLRAEEALRQERDFAESLIATAHDIVLVLDLEGRIVRFNPYLEDLSGFRLDEVRGQDWFTTFNPERERPALREKLRRLTEENGDAAHVSSILTRKGAERIIEWSSKLLKDSHGNRLGVLRIGRDVTELKEAQQRALQAERLAAIGQMVAGLTHESRNALQRSHACLEMLTLEVPEQPNALDLIARIQKAQDHLHQLFEDVREYAASIRLERRSCDLAGIWQEAWSHLRSVWLGRTLSLSEETAGVDLRCQVDPFRLGQTFHNILENALAACGDPVQITIACSPAELDGQAAIQIAVRDNGPGLTPEQAQKIFEPFYTTKTRGTGLGMAIAKRIVDAHGGRLEAGNSRNSGAEIRIMLPKGDL